MQTTLDKLYSRIELRIVTGCWNWTGTALPTGYGQIIINKRRLLAHRVSYEQFVGKIPSGMVICHKCDNPRCINPEHLFVGSQKENMQDMARKGRRSWSGTRISKVHPDFVFMVDRLRGNGWPYYKIGELIGLSKTHVKKIHERSIATLGCRQV